MSIEKLRQEHFFDCIKIISKKKKVAGTVPVSLTDFYTDLEKYLIDDAQYLAFGYFEQGILRSFITIIFKETITRGRFWVITNFFSDLETNYFSFNNPYYGDLVRSVIDYAESKDYHKFYYSIAKKVDRVYETLWAKNSRSRNFNYILETVAEIPANTRPSEDLYWKLMGQTLKPDIILIKCRYKNEIHTS
jgi:hypothetical protein